MICNFHTCSVCQCEENEVPLPWMQDSENDDVNKNILEKFHQWVEKYNYSSPNWIVENEIDSRNGIFVNLENNGEAFTGYQGQHIWNAIYYENCFKLNSPDQLCREEKTLYKIISGLHANINLHLSKNYLDIQNNLTYYNKSMLSDRVLNHPERLNNLFFLHSLLYKAFYKAESLIKNYHYYTGNATEDNKTKNLLDDVFEIENSFCEECLSLNSDNSDNLNFNFNFDKFLKFNPMKLDELKLRFRNISQIIDCVSCQKCKLHGKLQIYGLATMLKILFADNYNNICLKRNELISFVNLVGKVSRSVHYLREAVVESEKNINKNDQKLSLELFLVFLIPLSFFLLMMNRYFLAHKNQLEKKLVKNKKIANNQIRNSNSTNSNNASEEAQLLNYLNNMKGNEDYIVSNINKKKN